MAMISFSYTIQGAEGLHARPVAQICATAMAWQSTIKLKRAGKSVLATDLMGLMGLDARRGEELEVSIDGPDEAQAADALREVFDF